MGFIGACRAGGGFDGMGGLSRFLKVSVISLLKVPRGLLALNRKRGQIREGRIGLETLTMQVAGLFELERRSAGSGANVNHHHVHQCNL